MCICAFDCKRTGIIRLCIARGPNLLPSFRSKRARGSLNDDLLSSSAGSVDCADAMELRCLVAGGDGCDNSAKIFVLQLK